MPGEPGQAPSPVRGALSVQCMHFGAARGQHPAVPALPRLDSVPSEVRVQEHDRTIAQVVSGSFNSVDMSATVSFARPPAVNLRDKLKDLAEDVKMFRDDTKDMLVPVTGLLNSMGDWAPNEGARVDTDGVREGGRLRHDVERRRQLMTLNATRIELYLSMVCEAAREMHVLASEVDVASSGAFDEDE